MKYQRARWLRDQISQNWALCLVYALHSIACLAVLSQPGLGGVGYLSAFAIGLVHLFTAPLFGLIGKSPDSLKEVAKRIGLRSGILFIMPTLMALWQHRTVPMCTPQQDIGYWLLGPGFGSFIGVTMGTSLRGWCGQLRLRWTLLAWFGLASINLIWHLWRFYTEPSVFLYHPVAGYLAGPIYDAQGAVPQAYLIHRFWWLLTVPIWIAPWMRRRTLWSAAGLLVIGLGFSFRSPLGFDPGRRAVLAELSHTEVGTHTVVHIDPDGVVARSAPAARLAAGPGRRDLELPGDLP